MFSFFNEVEVKKKRFIRLVLHLKWYKILLGIYLIIAVVFYSYQEKFLFIPDKLSQDYTFSFNQDFEEINIKTVDNIQLNSVLFKVKNSKGLIFYLHGNGGSIASWGRTAQLYTALGYDIFILDYRGYGKSQGRIINQKQLFDDNQLAYDIMKKRYKPDEIIILGYSLGTGLAAKLASTNKAKMLILQAPYYNLPDVIRTKFIASPTFLLKYKLDTNKYLVSCEMPIVLFHGDKDKITYYESSKKLLKEHKNTKDIQLITLAGQGHNGMSNNLRYQQEIAKLLK